MNQNLSIEVDNLKCHGCANTIKKAVVKQPGVKTVSVDVEKGLVTVEGNSTVSESDVLAVLSGLGYPKKGSTNGYQKARSYISCAVGRIV